MNIHELNCVFLNVLLANQGRHRCQKQFRGSVFDGSSATDPDDPISRLASSSSPPGVCLQHALCLGGCGPETVRR